MHIALFSILLILLIFISRALLTTADEFSDATGLSHALLGFFIISIITSLPELSTSIGANFLGNEPDMAFSDIIGSNAFNIGILFVLLFFFNTSLDSEGKYSFILFYILIEYALMFVLSVLNVPPAISKVVSLLFIAGYVFSIMKFKDAGNNQVESAVRSAEVRQSSSVRRIVFRFVLYSLAVIATGIFLSLEGKVIAHKYNMSSSFVGALFLAISTSFPEVIVTFFALKSPSTALIGIGNIVGSNLFNINIISANDLAMKKIFYRHISAQSIYLLLLNVALTLYILLLTKIKKKRALYILGALIYILCFILIYRGR